MQVNVTTPTETTPITPARSIAPAPVNFASDWRIIGEKPGEVTLVNIQDPVVGATQARFAYSSIEDVFKGTSLEAPGPAASGSATLSKKGMSLLVQVNGSATEAGDPGQQLFPWSAHLVLRLPAGPTLESEDGSILQILQLLSGMLFETGQGDMGDRIDSLLHGALKPAGM